ncbi:MAG: hypothetical protein KJ566_00865 [Nanoarchaeota archaeon]|nr:hypothetical protein [Nanoarchaeota archaeon]
MAINISLSKDFKIQSDTHQFILVERDRAVGFYGDLETLILDYFKRKILDCDAKTITHLLEVHKNALRTLQQLLTPFKIEVRGVNSQLRPKEFIKKCPKVVKE